MASIIDPTSTIINGWLRVFCGIFALAIALGAIVVLCNPPIRLHVEKDASGSLVKQSESPADLATPFAVVFLTAIALILYVVNGYRITKLTAGNFSAEALPPAAQNAVKYLKTESLADVSVTNEVKTESPEPTEPPSKVVTSDSETHAVFELTDIPFSVIADAISFWPKEILKPKNLAEFEFATRKQGKGNHPWIIKFNGCKPIKVAYGGRSKSEPSVDAAGAPGSN